MSTSTPTPAEPVPAQPSAGGYLRLITRREVVAKLRDKAFLASVAFLIVVVAASIGVPAFMNRHERPALTVAAVGTPAQELAAEAARAAAVRDPLPGQPTVDLTVQPVADVAAAERAVREGSADAALVVPEGGRPPELIGREDVPGELAELVMQADSRRRMAQGFTAAGLDPGVGERVVASATAPPAVRLLDPPDGDSKMAIMLGYVFTLLFFFTTFIFGLSIAQSVVEEKQSRVVELLVAAVPVRVLLAGKVLANTLLALGQTVLLLGVGLAGALILDQAEVVRLLLRASGWYIAFFVLGFTMLACLWAASGSVASRQEDLQATTVPMQVLVMGPFFVTAYVTDPGRLLTTLSYVPFTSPLVMPRRMMNGDAAWWEGLLSAGIVVVTGALLVVLASRLYEGSLLRTGNRTSLRAAWAGEGTPREPAGA